MDENIETRLPEAFVNELAEGIPSLPENAYLGVRHRIDRKRAMVRTVWAAAAMLVILVTAFGALHAVRRQGAYVPEVAEEISGVSSYINSDVYKENDTSYAYYEETLYQE